MIRAVLAFLAAATAAPAVAQNIWLERPAGMVFGQDFSGGRLTGPTAKTVSLEGSASVPTNCWLATTGAVADQGTVADSDDLSFTDGAGQDKPFAVSCWVYLTSLPTTGNRAGVMRKGTKQGTTTWEWDCWAQLLDNTTGPTISVRHSNSAAVIQRYSPPLAAGQWYHLVFWYDGSESVSGLRVYQNGSRVDNASGTSGTYTGMSNTATPVNIGTSSFGGLNGSMNGRVDDIRIFMYAPTEQQIQRLYNQGRK